MTPVDVTVHDRKKLWELMYEKPYLTGQIKQPFSVKYRYRVNDVVTISLLFRDYSHGWHESFTHEFFFHHRKV